MSTLSSANFTDGNTLKQNAPTYIFYECLCIKKLVSEMTYYVTIETQNDSLTLSLPVFLDTALVGFVGNKFFC